MKFLNFSSNLVLMTNNWISQLFTLQQSTVLHQCLIIQLIKNTQWQIFLIQSSTISLVQLITLMNLCNSKFHFWTTMTMLDVLVLDVFSVEQSKLGTARSEERRVGKECRSRW